MKILKIFGAIIFACAAIGGITSLGSVADETVRSQTAFFSFLFVLFAVLCILSIRWGDKKKAKKLAQKQELERQKQEAQQRQMERINEISALTELPTVSAPMAIVLKDGEICHYQSNAISLVVKNQVVGRTGGSGGVSIRVAKGVTIHSGRSAGQTIRENVPYYYPGIFSVTNQRIIMTGENGFDQSISKLTALIPYKGFQGITLQFGKSNYTLLMDEPYWVPKIMDLLRIGVKIGE